jgi:hypothetical protein
VKKIAGVMFAMLVAAGCSDVGRTPQDFEARVRLLADVKHLPPEWFQPKVNDQGKTYFTYPVPNLGNMNIFADSKDAPASEVRLVVPSAAQDEVGLKNALVVLADVVNVINDSAVGVVGIPPGSPGDKALDWLIERERHEGDLVECGRCTVEVVGAQAGAGYALSIW